MAFEPWSLRPDYSAIPLFYNFTKSHVSVFRITVYILISALQNLEKKLEANGRESNHSVEQKKHTPLPTALCGKSEKKSNPRNNKKTRTAASHLRACGK